MATMVTIAGKLQDAFGFLAQNEDPDPILVGRLLEAVNEYLGSEMTPLVGADGCAAKAAEAALFHMEHDLHTGAFDMAPDRHQAIRIQFHCAEILGAA